MVDAQDESHSAAEPSISPVGSDAHAAQQRRRNRSVEYRRLDDQFAATRELAAQVISFGLAGT